MAKNSEILMSRTKSIYRPAAAVGEVIHRGDAIFLLFQSSGRPPRTLPGNAQTKERTMLEAR
jgi:hypothetical protein